MKIAILAPIAWRTPPRHYGPWEQMASNLAEGLVQQGHDVTLFATADSITSGTLEAVIATGYAEDPQADAKVAECLHISHLMEQAGQFDLLHNHFDFLPLTYSRLAKTPMVTTIHGFSSPKILPVFQRYNDIGHYVSISKADRSTLLRYAATVYNGVRVEDFPFHAQPQDYLLYYGRIHPHKGAHDAIQIALATGHRLLIAGIVQDEGYFNEKVKPFIDGEQIVFLGAVGGEKRSELLGNALALLHPIYFDEPFGLSVAEAMCCGTPVIAYNRGSMPELIVPGKTGFLVNGLEEAKACVSRLGDIKRADCNVHALAHFSVAQMVKGYEAVYEGILSR
ncbi:Glycosyltransferase involved in cell wall bisynthesis [Chitinophaga costaii]|uniref:Glycosyltransferase involved in cell wall bisynthesis n=1 Tax=Chitinophaga costaii TaxID=1335309 RepID=A0A1C4G6C6_9BACT|nr:glycosyltransferase family 4 protein [Chitinophaga costaii]PUZ19601.1 glycosyltransferase family 4 protein [Chitinophaga costaii]SCC63749.1 Glycosyltransferase involved in cell wall bisynthesis [Chitinophaga costaii]